MLDGLTQILSSLLNVASTIYNIITNIVTSLSSFLQFSLDSLQFIGTLTSPAYGLGGVLFMGCTITLTGIILRIVVDLL